MSNYLLIIASATLFAVAATPIARRAAFRAGVIDRPDPRKIHRAPIPLLGGAAIYSAFILALVFFGDRAYVRQAISILLGATLVSFAGVWDDRGLLHSQVKLWVVMPVAALLLIVAGIQVTLLPNLALNILATLVWVVGITSAFNLLDNMDGLSAGLAAIAAGFFLILAAMSGQYLVGALAAALLGACIGFLSYNFNPASIFMGDGGSLFIGFVLAVLGLKLRFPAVNTTVSWMIPAVVLAVPIFDTTLVTISRLRRGLNPLTTPGKDHVSHRLVAMGLSQRVAVLVLYATCGVVGGLALFLQQATAQEAYVLAGGLVVAGVIGLWRLEQVSGL